MENTEPYTKFQCYENKTPAVIKNFIIRNGATVKHAEN